MSDDYLVTRIDKDSQLIFKDNTVVGTTSVSNLVKFSEHGGYLEVRKTYLEGITVGGGKPLFGDERATGISINNCQFKHVQIDKSEVANKADTIIGSTNVNITSCAFIDVDNALIGGIANGLNQNGKLSVIGSTFKNCINTQYAINTTRQYSDRDNIITGDAEFDDTNWKD
ncbi:MAG: hypothetical protein EZS28_004350 [Streblomastix strix]|uniref:Uncharacterized protein n=1 Tax=Streblomastix strix TaxID=222440 RepID=A0A5J4WYE3_9EUKA|nr:MAG: hypothetical protein EZS28_004350 [Streblomastix strix]